MLHSTRGSILRQSQNYLRHSRSQRSPFSTTLARSLNSLAILEQREGKLRNASFSAITAAQKLGGAITGFIAGSNVKSVVEEAAKLKALDKIIMIENATYDKVGLYRDAYINFPHSLTISHRVFLKITPLYLSRTSRNKDSHMSWLGTRPSAKT